MSRSNYRLTSCWFAIAVLCSLAAWMSTSAADAQQPPGTAGAPEPPMLGTHWARGENPGQAHNGGQNRPSQSPNLTYHGGAVMHGTVVQPIFWGTSWTSGNAKVVGMATFYAGAGSTSYLGTNVEYTDTVGPVSSVVTSANPLIDTSDAPRRAPRTSAVLAEVQKLITNPVANGYYPVYVDTPRGNAGYCGWHSWGSINGVPVQFGFLFNMDGDPGCDPQDTWTTNPQGLAALANVSGHELSEVVTDPRGNAWYDSTGAENADKCAWTFNALSTFTNGSTWKIQGNWSNAAYDASVGYIRGCIDGN